MQSSLHELITYAGSGINPGGVGAEPPLAGG